MPLNRRKEEGGRSQKFPNAIFSLELKARRFLR
jgi:hypothetical protein